MPCQIINVIVSKDEPIRGLPEGLLNNLLKLIHYWMKIFVRSIIASTFTDTILPLYYCCYIDWAKLLSTNR